MLEYIQDLSEKSTALQRDIDERATGTKDMEEEMKERLDALQRREAQWRTAIDQLRSKSVQGEQVQHITEEALLKERQRTGTLDSRLQSHEEHARALRGECSSLHSQLDQLTEVNEQHRMSLERERAECERAKERARELEGSLRESSKVRSQMQEEMEQALTDMKRITSERDELQEAMTKAVDISGTTIHANKELEKKVHSGAEQIEKLQSSNQELRGAMLEQLGQVRRELEAEQLMRQRAVIELQRIRGDDADFSADAPPSRAAPPASGESPLQKTNTLEQPYQTSAPRRGVNGDDSEGVATALITVQLDDSTLEDAGKGGGSLPVAMNSPSLEDVASDRF